MRFKFEDAWVCFAFCAGLDGAYFKQISDPSNIAYIEATVMSDPDEIKSDVATGLTIAAAAEKSRGLALIEAANKEETETATPMEVEQPKDSRLYCSPRDYGGLLWSLPRRSAWSGVGVR